MNKITKAYNGSPEITFSRIDDTATSIVTGTVLGLLLFIPTTVLQVKGASPGGAERGPHLELPEIYLLSTMSRWVM
jgi:hypothetical protein